MSASSLRRLLWWAGWIGVAAGTATVAVRFGDPKLHGGIIGALTFLFVGIETFFWKLIDGTKGLFSSERFSSRQIIDLERTYHRQRKALARSYFTSLFLKLIPVIVTVALIAATPPIQSEWLYPRSAWLSYFTIVLVAPWFVRMVRAYLELADMTRQAERDAALQKRRQESQRDLHQTPT